MIVDHAAVAQVEVQLRDPGPDGEPPDLQRHHQLHPARGGHDPLLGALIGPHVSRDRNSHL